MMRHINFKVGFNMKNIKITQVCSSIAVFNLILRLIIGQKISLHVYSFSIDVRTADSDTIYTKNRHAQRIEKDCVFSWNISSKLLGFLCQHLRVFFSWMVILFSIFTLSITLYAISFAIAFRYYTVAGMSTMSTNDFLSLPPPSHQRI